MVSSSSFIKPSADALIWHLCSVRQIVFTIDRANPNSTDGLPEYEFQIKSSSTDGLPEYEFQIKSSSTDGLPEYEFEINLQAKSSRQVNE